jgi:hypothetical protein
LATGPVGELTITRFLIAIVVVLVAEASAFAQAQVRVIRDQAVIWRRDAPIAATTVKLGTVLEVTGREGEWYVVIIPNESGQRNLGLIAASQVEVFSGTPPTVAKRPADTSEPRTGRRSVAPRVGAFGFAHAGYNAWFAHDTFNAVLGSAGAPVFGGGAQVRVGHAFVEGAVERFEKAGQRVFVMNDEVFRLGILDTVQITPIFFTAGYRETGRRMAPYVGVGAGRYFYKETSDFADPSENVDERFTSYHALAGVEFATSQWLRAAIEVQVTTVPKALTSGAAAAFDEHNLGAVQVRVKLLAGR